MKRPSFQWYPNDWLSAPDVRACSVAARGLWIDMLMLMHGGEPYGHLTMNGKVVLPPVLARIVRLNVEEVETLLAELEDMGVFSRTEEGVIYCRRMVRDEELRQVRASGGFKALAHPNVPRPKLPDVDLEGIPSSKTSDLDQQPRPSSSSSSSSSEKTEEKASRASARSPRAPKLCDDDFLTALQAKEAYIHIDVRQLYAKMIVWCELKGKQPTRMRLVNWLNREDVPMNTSNGTHPTKRKVVV